MESGRIWGGDESSCCCSIRLTAGGLSEPLRFGLLILFGAVLYTWIYNHTSRNVLAAVLFYFSGNVSGELLDAPPQVYTCETSLTAVVVLGRW